MRLTKLLVLLLMWSCSFTATAQSNRLFDDETTPAQVQLPAHAVANQSRFVKVNRGLLGHKSFTLELFDGDYIAIQDRLEKHKGGSFVWVGHLEGIEASQVVFAFHKKHVSGFVSKDGETIELGTNKKGELILYRVDESNLPDLEPDAIPQAADPLKENRKVFDAFKGAIDSAIQQELLLVYTQSACDQRGGCDSLEADLMASVADTNQAYANSEVGIELKLVGMELLDYTEGGIIQSLKHLTWQQGHADDSEGYLDEVHALRDQAAADLVVLVSNDADYCGIGWVNSTAETAFSVVNWSCLSNRSLTHEIGHNQGNAHNRENAGVDGLFDFSYGHRVCEGQNGFRTVMSYSSSCDVPRVNHFSNPDIKFKGQDTGISEINTPETAANNALSLNHTATVVASFRQDPNASILITNPGFQQNKVEYPVLLEIETTSNSGQALSFSAYGLPAGASIDKVSGLISGTLLNDSVGYYTVLVYASNETETVGAQFSWRVTNLDGSGGENPSAAADSCANGIMGFIYYANYTIGYLKPGCSTTPVAPTITDPGQQTSLAGEAISLQIVAADGNGDTLTYSATGLPGGLLIDTSTGLISGNVESNQIGNYPVIVSVTDGTNTTDISFGWDIFNLSAVSELTHIWTDESSRLFKLAWRFPEAELADPYRTPAYFKVSPGYMQAEGVTPPPDVAFTASVGNRMWQSFGIDGFGYLGSTYWVAACVGDDQCGPLVAVNLQTASGSSDLKAVSQLGSTWLDEVAGTFILDWTYDADYFASSTGKPDLFRITSSMDPMGLSVDVAAGSPAILSWQSGTLDDDNFLGASYEIKACLSSGLCGPSQVMTLSRQLPAPAMPTPVWVSGNQTVDESLQFTLDWQPVSDPRVDYYTIEEQGPIGTSVFYTEADSIAMERATAGSYSFRIKACDRDRENGDSCGPYSTTVSVTMPEFAQMASISNLGWFWVNESEKTMRLNWKYPASAYNTSIGRPDYFDVKYYGNMWQGLSFNHSVDASNGDGDYTWVSNSMDLDQTWSQGDFEVRACTNGGVCGSPVLISPWSVPASPALDQDYATQSNHWDNPVASDPVLGGPDDMKPGSWWDPARAGTGWDFFWASELRYPAIHENYGNTYDLIAFWYAYQKFPDENGNDIWLPVWFYSELKLENDHYLGTLYFPTQTQDGEACDADNRCAVGKIEVFIDPTSNTMANVSVTIDKDAGLEGISNASFDLSYIGEDTSLFGSGGIENPHDHFSGMWIPDGINNLLDGNFATSHWTEGWFESVMVVHYDQNGVPIWTRAQADGRAPDQRDGSPPLTPTQKVAAVAQIHDGSLTFEPGLVFTVDYGFNPTTANPTYPAGHPNVGQPYDVSQHEIPAGSGGRLYEDHGIAGDSYEGYRKAGIWLDLSYTIGSGAGTRVVDLSTGTSSNPAKMHKLTNFHDIRFYVGGNRTEVAECALVKSSPELGGSCDLRLNWFTDSEYPDITAFLHNLDTGQYSKIATAGEGNAEYPATIGYPYSITQAGTYQLELWKHPDISGGVPDTSLQGNAQIAVSKELTVVDDDAEGVSDPDTPSSPTVYDEPPPLAVSNEGIGATAGSFRVDESGAATYNIPILTAPSTGNLKPDISLAYNSRLGNGLVGVGWQIAGTSTISRCSQTLIQDISETNPIISRGITMNSTDRFCLDGLRLMLIGVDKDYGEDGAEYRLETDTTVRIRSHGSQGSGPKSFAVWRGNGSVSYYGDWSDQTADSSEDALIGAHLDPIDPTAAGWAIDRIYDGANNYVTFDYEDSGESFGFSEHRLVGVNYAANDDLPENVQGMANRIELIYDDSRTDEKERYLAGRLFKNTKRLARIESLAYEHPAVSLYTIRSYKLSYDEDGNGRSALISLQECSDNTDTVCFAETQFAWNKSAVTFTDLTSNSAVYKTDEVFNAKLFEAKPADINGDGRLDMIWLKCDSYTANGLNKFASRVFYSLATGENEFAARQDAGRISREDTFCEGIFGVAPPVWTVMDYNNDGMTDIVFRSAGLYPNGSGWYGLASNGLGYEAPVTGQVNDQASAQPLGVLPFEPQGLYDETVQFGDYNGDGLVDVLSFKSIANANGNLQPHFYMQLNNGTPTPYSSGYIELDFDNIPVPDSVMETVTDYDFHIEFTPRKDYTTGSQVVDYNNDGATDILVRMRLSDTEVQWAGWVVLVSDGDGGFSEAVWARQENPVVKAEADVYLVDLNGDALADLVWLPPSADNPSYETCPHEYGYRINVGNGFGQNNYLNNIVDENNPCTVDTFTRMELIKRKASTTVQFFDFDGDMDTDILFPIKDGTKSTFKVLRWQGTEFAAAHEDTNLISREILKEGDRSMFVDMTGDGFIDQLFFQREANGDLDFVKMKTGFNGHDLARANTLAADYTLERHEPQNVITKVTNGFGDFVEIQYQSLTQSEVYQRENNARSAEWGTPLFDVIWPDYVVSMVSAYNLESSVGNETGTDSVANTHYAYRGARVQTGGRGLLGFSEIITFEENSNVRTATRYRQGFPYTGLPFDTVRNVSSNVTWNDFEAVSICPDPCSSMPDWDQPINQATARTDIPDNDLLMSYTRNLWNSKMPVANADVYMPVATDSLEITYNTPGQEYSRQTVNNTHDDYGNITQSIVTNQEMRDDTWVAVSNKTVNNEYAQDSTSEAVWVLGLLSKSERILTRGANTQTLTSTFGYNDYSGILIRETVDKDGDNETTIIYELDEFGNRISATVLPTPDGGTATTYYGYDPLGRYRQTTTNAFGQVVTEVLQRDAFGNPLESIDINDVSTIYGYDAMGRQYFSNSETGAWTQQVQHWTGGSTTICPSSAVYAETTTSASGPENWTCYDAQARVIRTSVVGFEGEINQTDTGYDLLGRAAFESIPYTRPGAGPTGTGNYTKTLFDEFNRPVTVDYPGGRHDSLNYDTPEVFEGTTYYGASTTETVVDSVSHIRTEIRDVDGNRLFAIDEKDGVTKYGYDAANNISSVDGPIDDDELTIQYNNRGWKTAMSDPDKGDWAYTYYHTGELATQTDGNGQIIEYYYDQSGRVIKRIDKMAMAVDNMNDAQTTIYQYINSTSAMDFGKAQLENVFICKGLTESCSGDDQPFSQTIIYDQFGRAQEADTTLNRLVYGESLSETLTTETVYDGTGRVFQEFERFMDVYRPNSGLQYNYNANGYLASLQESRGGADGLVYQSVESMDPWGNVIMSQLGNGVIVSVDYDPLTGRLIDTLATTFNSAIVQDLSYEWDLIGNLKLKKDVTSNSVNTITHEQTETYTYDLLNRLETVELSSPQLGISNLTTMSLDYDAAGNITNKAGLAYTYGELSPDCSDEAGPHAVSSYDGITYCYDINGNNTSSSDGRSITYTAYNKPQKIELGADASEFFYGPNRSRYRRVETFNNTLVEEAFYIGNTEIIDKDNGQRREYRRSIGGIAISHFYLRLDGSAGKQTDYVLQDNLGSPHTLLDELGQITYRVGFDAHGSRREGYDPRALILGINPTEDVTDRGFTGHEHLDVLGVIHMNGRIYDPKLGRFLQADPLIQDLGNSQSLNRYTYVFNNPLAYTDPSGYSALGKYLRPILSIGVAWATGGWAAGLFQAGNTAAALAVSIGGGALAGAIATGSGKGALIGAFTGAAAFGVGATTSGRSSGQISNRDSREGAQSATGGLQRWVNGSNFGSGVVAAESLASNSHSADFFMKISNMKAQLKIVQRATKLNEEDFRTLFPMYRDVVDSWGIDIAQMNMFEEFRSEIYSGKLLELTKRHAPKIIEESYRRGVSRGLGLGGKSIGALSKIMKLNPVQTRVFSDIYRVQNALNKFEGDIMTLGGLATYLRSNQEAANWYYSQ